MLEIQEDLKRGADLFEDIENPLVDYYPLEKHCAIHGIPLHIMKTDTRGILCTRYPPLTARKIYLYCPLCKDAPGKTEGLDWKYPPHIPTRTRGKSPFSMDVITQVGVMKFLVCRRRDEIQDELEKKYGIHASSGTLTGMSMEFLARIKCLHMLRFDRLVDDIKAGGGYILGIDGTGDGGSDRIFIGMDLLRDWVLESAKIPSEKEVHMKPHIESIRDKLGLPLVGVCDMSSAMMNVLENVMIDGMLRICHYHLLDDIGRDLMGVDYMDARKFVIDTRLQPYMKRLRKEMFHESKKDGIDISKIARELRAGIVPSGLSVEVCVKVQTYDIISWMLRYYEDNDGMRFPFSLPFLNFYQRCRKGLEAVTAIRRTAVDGRISPKYLRELESKLQDKLEGQSEQIGTFRDANATIRQSYDLFEELRRILDVPKNKGDIPRDKLIIENNEMIAKMRHELEEYRDNLRDMAADGLHPKEKIIVDHLDRYWSNIILDNVVANVDGEDVLIEIPRTSSGYETCFGMLKSDLRKRLGKKDIGRELNMYGDYLCYVQNLKSESYVSLMYGSLDDISRTFEEIPPEMVRHEVKSLRKRMMGYDITNSRFGGENVEIAEIMNGVKALEDRIEEVVLEEYLNPPEIYGCQSNGLLTL